MSPGNPRDACDHGGHGSDLRAASRRALWMALVVLGTFFVVEVVGGLLTNSLALLSDAAHLLSDVAAVALALVAQSVAQRRATAARSFGYRRVEILAALLNGSTLILVAIYIGHEAWQRLRAPPEVLSWPMMAVAAVGLVAQLLTALALGRVQGQSLNVRGAYVHALTDAIQSVGVVLTGLVMVLTGWYLADPIVSVLIGLLMSYSGARIIWDATHVLIEGTPRDVDLGRVAAMMRATPGVLRVTDLHAWTVTSGFNALSAHLEARADLDGAGYEALRSSLVERLRGSFPLHHVTLQIERDCELCRSGCCDWLEEGAGPGHKG